MWHKTLLEMSGILQDPRYSISMSSNPTPGVSELWMQLLRAGSCPVSLFQLQGYLHFSILFFLFLINTNKPVRLNMKKKDLFKNKSVRLNMKNHLFFFFSTEKDFLTQHFTVEEAAVRALIENIPLCPSRIHHKDLQCPFCSLFQVFLYSQL